MTCRSIAIALICAAALVTTSCSAKSPGTPETGADTPTGVEQTTGPAVPSDEGSSEDSGEDSGEDDTSVDSSDLSLDDLTSAQSALGDLSGLLSDECLAVAGLSMTVGLLLAAPFIGQSELTADDVSKAFDGLDKVPPELQDEMKVLHDAAVAATGKSLTEATTILGSDEVSAAFDQISTYLSAHCDGG